MTRRDLRFVRRSELVVLAVLTAATVSAADNPFVGEWKLSQSKSKLTDQMKVTKLDDNNYAFDFAGDGHGETIVIDGTDQPGNSGTTLAVTSEGPNASGLRQALRLRRDRERRGFRQRPCPALKRDQSVEALVAEKEEKDEIKVAELVDPASSRSVWFTLTAGKILSSPATRM